MKRTVTHLFFDLDGTLVDSFPGIEFSARAALERISPGRPAPDFRPFIGPPIREIFRRALREEDEARLVALEKAFRESYDGGGWKKTCFYPGVESALAVLVENQFTCLVLTNKPKVPTDRILEHLGATHFFKEIISPEWATPPYRTKVEAALAAKHRHALAPANALLAGDSLDDAAAAEACGFEFAAIEYGYGAVHLQTRHPIHHHLKDFLSILSAVNHKIPSSDYE